MTVVDPVTGIEWEFDVDKAVEEATKEMTNQIAEGAIKDKYDTPAWNEIGQTIVKGVYGECKSVNELTDGECSEITYSIDNPQTWWFFKKVCQDLRLLGYYNGEDTNEFTKELHDSIKRFQLLNGINNDGVFNTNTFMLLKAMANEKSGITITGGEDNEDNSDSFDSSGAYNLGAHYGTFFGEQNSKQFRQNTRDIRILLGDGTITKVIKKVYMRSVGVEVDSSGNPISETYEFIARDVCETDNEQDLDKYVSIGEDYAPMDYAVNYDFSSYTNPEYKNSNDTYTEKSTGTKLFPEPTIRKDDYNSYSTSIKNKVVAYLKEHPEYKNNGVLKNILEQHGLFDDELTYEEMLARGFYTGELDYLLE